MSEVVNLDERYERIDDFWAPRIVGALNDCEVKIVRVEGDFVWHKHDDTDEMFLIHKGAVNIQYRDRDNWVRAGELFIVPKGVEHRPCADGVCEMLLIEPRGTVNTGDAGGARTRAPVWMEERR